MRMTGCATRCCACAVAGSKRSRGSARATLLRRGLSSHTAMLPEEVSDALDAHRVPLSAIADADVVVILGDSPVVERAPIVDLWVRQARRNGARVVQSVDEAGPGSILIWCGPDGEGGARVAELAQRVGA